MFEAILLDYLPFILMMVGTFLSGRFCERRHYASIVRREQELDRIEQTSLGRKAEFNESVVESRLVCGEAVISVEFFRWFVGMLHGLFGGALREYESALDRARREAILRMKLSAGDAVSIINVRIEHTPISYGLSRFSGVEAIAYGTAIYKESR